MYQNGSLYAEEISVYPHHPCTVLSTYVFYVLTHCGLVGRYQQTVFI
jgi:hypothetical protein